jgi:uncharacterized protein (TIGR02118 family)
MGVLIELLEKSSRSGGDVGPWAAALEVVTAEQYDRVARVETDTLPEATRCSHQLSGLSSMRKFLLTEGRDFRQTARALTAGARNPIGWFASAPREVISPGGHGEPLVRISILSRKPGLSSQDFAAEWHGRHAELLRALPGCRGYIQNLITDRFAKNGAPAAYEELPYDGIAELYFDDEEAMQLAYRSAAREALRTHARSILGNIVTFVMLKTGGT